MKVYAVVTKTWNCEYGYDEYSLPIKLFTNEDNAKEFAESYESEDFEKAIVVPCDLI